MSCHHGSNLSFSVYKMHDYAIFYRPKKKKVALSVERIFCVHELGILEELTFRFTKYTIVQFFV